MKRLRKNIISALLVVVLCLTALPAMSTYAEENEYAIPEYSGSPYVAINNNTPDFDTSIATDESFEYYNDLDSLGRCGYASANLGLDLMPTEERDSIGSVKPTGWHTVKYDIVDGNYLYNRCHLIGYQLSGENANEKNLITGTRYLNVEGMLPFENMVADYIQETGNHVFYMVTPMFEGNDLVARGVNMQALSIEDEGEGICFNVFCYNVQPGIVIDYTTGNSYEEDSYTVETLPNTTTYTATANVNVRSAETTQSEVLGQIEYGAHAEVISVSDDWAKVLFCDQAAYVAAAYLVKGTSLPQQEVFQQPVEESVAIAPTEAPVQQPVSEAMVWIPNTGSKYHSNPGCSNMKNPTQVSISQAQFMGYEPCKKCY